MKKKGRQEKKEGSKKTKEGNSKEGNQAGRQAGRPVSCVFKLYRSKHLKVLRLLCPTNEDSNLTAYVDITKTVSVKAVISELAGCPENARIYFNQRKRKGSLMDLNSILNLLWLK